jgi:predicted phage terminase large subunit-like protein
MAKRRKSLPAPTPEPPVLRTPGVDPIAAALERQTAAAARARTGKCRLSFPDFFRKYPPAQNYLWGRHTIAIAALLNHATEVVESGGQIYIIITVPPRHGKSDQASRRYPAWHLLRNPDHEVILATHTAELSQYLSRSARRAFSEAGQEYGLVFADDQNQVGCWGIQGHTGGMYSIGIGGSAPGHGAHVLIIDDYCRNREEAESETIRERVWDAFRSDLMTRLAPAHAVVIVATPYNEDDLIGRIEKEAARNPEFPKFQRVRFPALNDDGTYLFPERFPPEWYRAQRAAIGEYAWQSLYQCDPKPRIGRLLRADLVKIEKKMPEGLRWHRGWDLASTEKERVKDDPDFTVGTKSAWDGTDLWIADVRRGQWAAPERDKRIVDTAKDDGRGVVVHIEVVAGYKDTYERVRKLLWGIAIVRKQTPDIDKVAKAAPFEPLFEASRVHLLEAPWNREWIAEHLAFPRGKKDDQVDSTIISAMGAIGGRRRASFG